ncbi:MAG: hypothetical protein ACK58L_06430 [Planctomycetota bacterium]
MKSKEPPRQPPTVAIAMMLLLVFGGGFIALVSMVLPQFLFVVVAGLGIGLFFAAQYFLWARWLYPIVRRWEIDNGRITEKELTEQD